MPALQHQALLNQRSVALNHDGLPTRIRVANVTPSYFRVMPVRPELGRVFTDPEGEIGNEKKVLLSASLWQSVFGVMALRSNIDGLLFGVQPLDPVVIGGALAILTGVALLACTLPARRATQIAPLGRPGGIAGGTPLRRSNWL